MSGNHNMYCSGNQPDIVQRLREYAGFDPDKALMHSQAADEIESLRQQLENARTSATNGWNAYEDLRKASDEMIIELRQQLEAAQIEISSMKDHVRAVVNDLAECERERDELVAALEYYKRGGEFSYVAREALAKLGADKGEK